MKKRVIGWFLLILGSLSLLCNIIFPGADGYTYRDIFSLGWPLIPIYYGFKLKKKPAPEGSPTADNLPPTIDRYSGWGSSLGSTGTRNLKVVLLGQNAASKTATSEKVQRKRKSSD